MRSRQQAPDDFLKTYSQTGEDRILLNLFKTLGIAYPSYIDVGANHPTILNNTYLFYLNGSKGINIEPDPELIKPFGVTRPDDINLNIGIGTDNESSIDFYIMSNRVLNTFSKHEAERVAAYGTYTIESTIKVEVVQLQKIIGTYFPDNNGPDFISIDVEGFDFQILETLDLAKYPETVFCVETINYSEDNTEIKNADILNYFAENGFMIYADTYINTIFINRNYWLNRAKI